MGNWIKRGVVIGLVWAAVLVTALVAGVVALLLW